jgi:hypothetical protein
LIKKETKLRSSQCFLCAYRNHCRLWVKREENVLTVNAFSKSTLQYIMDIFENVGKFRCAGKEIKNKNQIIQQLTGD